MKTIGRRRNFFRGFKENFFVGRLKIIGTVEEEEEMHKDDRTVVSKQEAMHKDVKIF